MIFWIVPLKCLAQKWLHISYRFKNDHISDDSGAAKDYNLHLFKKKKKKNPAKVY